MDRNGRLILAAKAARGFGFGLSSVALGLYLAEIGLDGGSIGAVLSAALVGTMLLTLVITLRGDRLGRRRMLGAGGALMVLAVLIPAVGGHPVVLVLLGLSGMVAVTGKESTGLETVDQAALPQTVPPERRTAAFAAYNVVAAVSAAIGSLAIGPMTTIGAALGFTGADRYAPAFGAYAVAGVLGLVLASRLDARVEVGRPVERGFALRRSRGVVARLASLFAVDAFASGLIVQSFLAFWFAERFGLDAGTIGALAAGSHVLTAVSFPVAAWLAARLGLVRTMVYTHLPASALLIGMALAPSAAVAAVLFLVRSLLASMDVPARQSYTMSVVDVDERTATAGVTNLAKTGAQTAGPFVAGALLVPLGLGVPLIACGLLKGAYDLALFALFRARPAPDEPAALQPRIA